MNIIDDSFGKVIYKIPSAVVVIPNNELANLISDSILNQNPYCQAYIYLNSGNLNLIAKNVIALSTVFNIQSESQTAASSSSSGTVNLTQIDQVNNQMATLREFLVNKVTELSVSDISSIKVISSALSAATQSTSQISSKTAVKNILF